MFNTKTIHTLTEVEKGTKLPELNADLKESLKTLPLHPAFNYLTQKMRLQASALAKALHEGADLEERQMRYLQAGIFWLTYLDSEIRRLTHTTMPSRQASLSEAEEFDRVHKQMDLIS